VIGRVIGWGKRWSPARRLEHVGREVRELDLRMGRQRAELTRLNAAVADSASARDALAAEHAAAQGGAAGQLQARPAAASLQRRRPCSRSRSWRTACCCKQSANGRTAAGRAGCRSVSMAGHQPPLCMPPGRIS